MPNVVAMAPLGNAEAGGGLHPVQASAVTPVMLSPCSEVIHARWAMLGAAGIIAPEILSGAGVIPQSVDTVTWWKSGLIPPLGVSTEYWMDPFSLFFVEVILMQFAELKRCVSPPPPPFLPAPTYWHMYTCRPWSVLHPPSPACSDGLTSCASARQFPGQGWHVCALGAFPPEI